ncbi:MAG: chemotaxis protein CheW [Longimicrobiales bacterium]
MPPGEETLVVVRIRDLDYGLPVAAVREVVRAPAITAIPHVPRAVRGVASIRGEIVPIVDLGLRLGGGETSADGRVVLVDSPSDDGAVGLLVAAVVGLTPVLPREGEAGEPAEDGPGAPFARAVVRAEDGRPIRVLALAPLLDLGLEP